MTSRLILRLAPALLLTTLAFPVAAAPKDAAATTKIDEAINVHYLATDFNKAEGQLLGVVKACGKDCSPAVLGRAWMYVGLVRGSGKQDLAGAREAFAKAKEADPSTQIDTALATPEVQAEFDVVFAGGGAPAPAGKGKTTPAPAPSGAADPGGAGSALDCSIDAGSEIEMRRPIPISCAVPEGAKQAVLAYKEFGGTQFSNLPMTIQEGNARAAIPCSATKLAGALSYVIIVKDTSKATVGSVGSLEQPATLSIVQSTIQPPPAFPGEAPPARCAEEVECPPGMAGCTRSGGGGWGDACTPAELCKKGLYCSAGTCENAPSCEIDGDCQSGRCAEGFCDMGDAPGPGGGGGFRKIWVGAHFAPDIYFYGGGDNVCSLTNAAVERKYACYEADNKTPIVNGYPQSGGFPNSTFPNGQGTIKGGAKLTTVRALLSLEYALSANILAGVRLGFAFNGGPKSYTYQFPNVVKEGKAFLPIHIEPRLTYHFVSLGKPGLHPYIHAGGGLAQIDGQMKIQICGQAPAADLAQCPNPRQVYVYKRLGQGFVTIGGGAMYPLGKRVGAVLNLNLMYMLPDSGFVVEPSLGFQVGF